MIIYKNFFRSSLINALIYRSQWTRDLLKIQELKIFTIYYDAEIFRDPLQRDIHVYIQWQSKLFGRLEKKFSSIYIYEMKEAADL